MPELPSDASPQTPAFPSKTALRRIALATLRAFPEDTRTTLSAQICARLAGFWQAEWSQYSVAEDNDSQLANQDHFLRRREPMTHGNDVSSPDLGPRLFSQRSSKRVAAYLALSQEPNLDAFSNLLLASHNLPGLVVPRGSADQDAPLCPLRDLQDVEHGPFGTREPRLHADLEPVAPHEVGLWLVPGLAFDEAGHRLGRGGGWYDRVLSRAHPRALIYGVAFGAQLVPVVPREGHDVRLDGIVTESRIIETRLTRAAPPL